jgi:hypothetical protein
VRQEPVLLGLVEAVDLVNEQERPLPVRAPVLGRLEDLAQVGHAGEDGAELDEMQVGRFRQKPRDRRLADAGRTPQDQRRQRPGGQHRAERPLGRQHLLLADHLGQRLRPQPVGQRARRSMSRGVGVVSKRSAMRCPFAHHSRSRRTRKRYARQLRRSAHSPGLIRKPDAFVILHKGRDTTPKRQLRRLTELLSLHRESVIEKQRQPPYHHLHEQSADSSRTDRGLSLCCRA